MNPDAIGAEMSPESRGLDVPDGYRRLRQDKAAAPVGRDVIRVIGPDAVDYMQGQCSQDVAALEPGNSADALLLEPQGRVDAFVRVTRTGEDELIVDTDAGWGDVVVARLERFKLRVKVEISRRRMELCRGPRACGRLGRFTVGDPADRRRLARSRRVRPARRGSRRAARRGASAALRLGRRPGSRLVSR